MAVVVVGVATFGVVVVVGIVVIFVGILDRSFTMPLVN